MLDLSYTKRWVFWIKAVTLNTDLCVAPESIALERLLFTYTVDTKQITIE